MPKPIPFPPVPRFGGTVEVKFMFTLAGEHFETIWFLKEVAEAKVKAIRSAMKDGDRLWINERILSASGYREIGLHGNL